MAVLSSIVIIAINPPKLLQESRDLKRISDLASIDKAINQLMGYAVTSSIFGGQPNIVYISIPDASSTCANLGLPSLPSGWSYSCSTQANYRNVDGTGWLPINFSALSIGSPLSNLPIDPKNQTSTNQYYTYVTGGSYELTAILESEKYADKSTNDGGIDPATLEIGSDLKLSPFVHGLVGYWNFDETGTTALDKSGFANNGTMFSATTITDLHLASTTCKTGGRCSSFDGADDYVNAGSLVVLDNLKTMTIVVWIYPTGWGEAGFGRIVNKKAGTGNAAGWTFALDQGSAAIQFIEGFSTTQGEWLTPTLSIALNTWQHVVVTYDRSSAANNPVMYINGVVQTLSEASTPVGTASSDAAEDLLIGNTKLTDRTFAGRIDETMIFNRTLSSNEVKAIYNATK